MKRLILIFIIALCLTGCTPYAETADIVTTTKPLYDFTAFLCQGTPLQVSQLISEGVSCLHDYSLSVSQVRALQAADTVVISGADLEDFMDDLLSDCETVIDSSLDVPLLECSDHHAHDHHGHEHELDAHIWLAPENARKMVHNICAGLCAAHPDYADRFSANLLSLLEKLDALQRYAKETLSSLSCRELITFHDGFSYMAYSFNLDVAAAVEEESGSEASAKELIALIELIETRKISAIFVETNGSTSAAQVIAAETGVPVYTLDMGMSGDYFDIMYRNIDTLKEALG